MRALRLIAFTGSHVSLSHPGWTGLMVTARILASVTGFQKINIRKGQHDESMA